MTVKILHINFSEAQGGAATGCHRLHKALLKYGIGSKVMVCAKQTDDLSVINVCNTKWKKLKLRICNNISTKVLKLQKTNNPVLHSLNLWGIIKAKEINATDCDIVHLHWIGNSTISIKEIAKITKPIVWTFRDEWPFCGAEHYDSLDALSRFVEGYLTKNKNVKGFDINRWIWKKKKKHWGYKNIYPIALSQWMLSQIEKSFLFRNSTSTVVSNTLNGDVYKQFSRKQARDIWNLSQDKKLILFGAMSATSDKRKGYDLLVESLQKLNDTKGVELVVFGASFGKDIEGLKTHFMGHLHDDTSLALLYNACDVAIVPSMQESFGNTCLEAISCGVPVVGFDKVGGLPDMIVHKQNGYLAKPYEADDLANGINYILENPDNVNFSKNAREHFEKNFSEKVVAKKLVSLYDRVIKKDN